MPIRVTTKIAWRKGYQCSVNRTCTFHAFSQHPHGHVGRKPASLRRRKSPSTKQVVLICGKSQRRMAGRPPTGYPRLSPVEDPGLGLASRFHFFGVVNYLESFNGFSESKTRHVEVYDSVTRLANTATSTRTIATTFVCQKNFLFPDALGRSWCLRCLHNIPRLFCTNALEMQASSWCNSRIRLLVTLLSATPQNEAIKRTVPVRLVV